MATANAFILCTCIVRFLVLALGNKIVELPVNLYENCTTATCLRMIREYGQDTSAEDSSRAKYELGITKQNCRGYGARDLVRKSYGRRLPMHDKGAMDWIRAP